MLERTKSYYDKEFVEKERSPQSIADEWGTYPNKIRRELVRLGYKLRSKSEAQSLALQHGRHKHPTKGKQRPERIKIKISEGMANNWKNLTDEERVRRSELSRQQWDAMPDSEKQKFREAALKAVREASKEGSKLEKFLLKELQRLGYEVLFHSEHLLSGTRLHTDLFIPSCRIIIEVDGPSHFYPIWGQEALDNTIEADTKKNSLLLSYGFVVIRVKHLAKTLSQVHKRRLLEEVKYILDMPTPLFKNRLIEVELN